MVPNYELKQAFYSEIVQKVRLLFHVRCGKAALVLAGTVARVTLFPPVFRLAGVA